ncbi:oxidoreductase family, NAD-binding Rossmann fold protein [Aspergillus eucalypticola CBS 122712]|uniref:Oxidoreductase family, NAD-binding Rossmann fold protein n=1 Tax=Aspergillus eucalypticola (strain CBS 122712 / IBT 29274) TaxID=1448314 RepID=A0A317UT05_ASPEC|nr:oxidoreductase family, NAD-binding Rossmann fold protein [Aspergillus eucalypticola CBS 122712]PWY63592.1 oxidoreductase family, NAD-binding Rossmann fold protein [Aspergillus eucalypticola CBS 122712]
MSSPIGVAIVGSGIFAKEEHLPILTTSPLFTLKAIYSRSLKSAESLISGSKGDDAMMKNVELYSEDSEAGRRLQDLLDREDVRAVVIALPIPAQPSYIRAALQAGKHVLSEKPIAGDLNTARALLSEYQALATKPLWGVAENWRFLAKFTRVAEEVRKLGTVKAFRVSVRTLIGEGSKYHQTEWRRKPTYKGGFVLDGGVHAIAGLRLILGKEDAMAAVSAMMGLQREHLAPVDTLDAVVKTKSGANGVVSLSYGAAVNETVFEFSCERGVVKLDRDTVTVSGGESFEVPYEGRGVNYEVAAFGESILKGQLEERLRPEEALADLEVMEGMFVSEGGKVLLDLQ